MRSGRPRAVRHHHCPRFSDAVAVALFSGNGGSHRAGAHGRERGPEQGALHRAGAGQQPPACPTQLCRLSSGSMAVPARWCGRDHGVRGATQARVRGRSGGAPVSLMPGAVCEPQRWLRLSAGPVKAQLPPGFVGGHGHGVDRLRLRWPERMGRRSHRSGGSWVRMSAGRPLVSEPNTSQSPVATPPDAPSGCRAWSWPAGERGRVARWHEKPRPAGMPFDVGVFRGSPAPRGASACRPSKTPAAQSGAKRNPCWHTAGMTLPVLGGISGWTRTMLSMGAGWCGGALLCVALPAVQAVRFHQLSSPRRGVRASTRALTLAGPATAQGLGGGVQGGLVVMMSSTSSTWALARWGQGVGAMAKAVPRLRRRAARFRSCWAWWWASFSSQSARAFWLQAGGSVQRGQCLDQLPRLVVTPHPAGAGSAGWAATSRWPPAAGRARCLLHQPGQPLRPGHFTFELEAVDELVPGVGVVQRGHAPVQRWRCVLARRGGLQGIVLGEVNRWWSGRQSMAGSGNAQVGQRCAGGVKPCQAFTRTRAIRRAVQAKVPHSSQACGQPRPAAGCRKASWGRGLHRLTYTGPPPSDHARDRPRPDPPTP